MNPKHQIDGVGVHKLVSENQLILKKSCLISKTYGSFEQGEDAFRFFKLYGASSEIDFLNNKLNGVSKSERVSFLAGYFFRKDREALK